MIVTAQTEPQQSELERDRQRRQWIRRRGEINISPIERKISGVAGAALVVLGIRRRSLGGVALAVLGGVLVDRAVSGHCPAYAALGIDTSPDQEAPGGTGADPQKYFDRGIHVEQSFTINKSPEELYRYWRQLDNLPTFMKHLDAVTVLDDRKSHWVIDGPAGTKAEWDAEIINDEPNALIAWRSLGGAEVDNAGSVRFVPAPAGRGTEVRVVIDYIPPAGQVGRWVAKLFGKDPDQQIKEDLRRFKNMMEAGEIPTTDSQPRGNCGGSGRRQRHSLLSVARGVTESDHASDDKPNHRPGSV